MNHESLLPPRLWWLPALAGGLSLAFDFRLKAEATKPPTLSVLNATIGSNATESARTVSTCSRRRPPRSGALTAWTESPAIVAALPE